MSLPFILDRTCAAPGCSAPRDRWLTARLLVALPLLAAAMRLFGFCRTYTALGRRPIGAGSRRSPHRIAALVMHVNRHVLPYQSRCLLESLALWHLLRSHGHDAELLLGARTLLGPLEAHAWVELGGEVLNDADNVRQIYQTFEMEAIRPESP